MYDWERISETWQGEGNQQIVTALFPRKPTPEKTSRMERKTIWFR